jgi:hypothetical protein
MNDAASVLPSKSNRYVRWMDRGVGMSSGIQKETTLGQSTHRVTVRTEAKVRKQRYDGLDAALDAVERIGGELAADAHATAVGGELIRRLEPVQQVVGRIELTGPRRLRAGVDVRGDGSSEAYTGRLRRRLVEQGDGESAYDALRRRLL